ncbi:MAG: hypothetical protein ABIJ92_04470 [Candidatus Aenigmatarchaeota archaeon]
MTPEEGMKILNQYLSDMNKLREKRYYEGKDELNLLDRKIKTFINRVFPDYEERQKDYYRTVHAWFIATMHEETEEEKQTDYMNQIRKMTLFVNTLLDELQVFGLASEKFGPTKTETEKEISGGIPGILKGKYKRTKSE